MGRVSSVPGMAMALTMALGAGLAVRTARADDLAGYAQQVLDLVNQERQAAGLAPLRRAPELDQSAQRFAQYMGTAHFFDHRGPDGSGLHSRIAAAGYHGYTWAENIAAGQRTPQAVVRDWMNSPEHRSNILHSALKEIGIGVARVPDSPMGIYWVQDFGARKGAEAARNRRWRQSVSVAWFGVFDRGRRRAAERREAQGGYDTVETVRPPTGSIDAEP